jgi:hypothetical protein
MFNLPERLAEPSETINGAAWQWLNMLRCAAPGKVVSFDPDKQTCVVQIAVQETVYKAPVGEGQAAAPPGVKNVPTAESIWPLEDVPIWMPRVPGWSITFPITPGTECLLIFADMCIDGWYQTGKVIKNQRRRRHHLSDAFALFGPWSIPNRLQNYSTSSMQIRSDDQSVLIELESGQVNIKAPTVNVEAGVAKIGHTGGTPAPLPNDAFYQWFVATYMPSVQYVTIAPVVPSGLETDVLQAE